MLDEAISSQLRQVFGALEAKLSLVVAQSTHERQGELIELAQGLVATSPQLDFAVVGEVSEGVLLSLYKNGQPTGVSFRGVPGGHEFTSLVLAILNADGKGKLPDAGVQA